MAEKGECEEGLVDEKMQSWAVMSRPSLLLLSLEQCFKRRVGALPKEQGYSMMANTQSIYPPPPHNTPYILKPLPLSAELI